MDSGLRRAQLRGLSKRFLVNAVSLGAILTERRLGTIEELAGGHKTSIEVAKQNVLARAGIVRFGEADDVAELLAFLVSTRARRLTGTALHIDGGEVEAI